VFPHTLESAKARGGVGGVVVEGGGEGGKGGVKGGGCGGEGGGEGRGWPSRR
jgi:hypothetical protein